MPILFSFFVMGFCDVVGISTTYVKNDFNLSEALAGFIPSMVFLWFLLLSVPVALAMNRVGRKRTVQISNVITIVGMLIPFVSYNFATCMVAFALLGLIGGSMLWEAVQDIRRTKKEGPACPAGRQFGLKMMLVQALATSIDALAVGVSFAALSVNIWLAAGFICCITFACCLLGHALGRRFGLLLGARAQLCGGVHFGGHWG